jgi:hypothetical protein
MDAILGTVLRSAVRERLDVLSELAGRGDAAALVSVARAEIPRLIEGWRKLLTAHEADEKGNCPECSGRRRPQQAPCAVWRSAYDHLVAGALAPSPARHQLSAREARAQPVP